MRGTDYQPLADEIASLSCKSAPARDWNMFAPAAYRFDPYPAFVLWLFISNMIQIFLMPLIMVGQNLQGKHSEIRAENDYEINLKAEKEIAALQKDLTEIKSLLKEYLEKE